MTVTRCRWCDRPATAQCTTKISGECVAVPYCNPDSGCWDRTYDVVRRHTPRTWTTIVQPAPDLLDLLPDEGARQ